MQSFYKIFVIVFLLVSNACANGTPVQDATKIVQVNSNNIQIVLNLANSYEAEFSSLTNKLPNKKGIFELDTLPTTPYTGYILYKNATPIGFSVINATDSPKDIAEFYIIPSVRQNGYGKKLAYYLFNNHPGKWQVRQIDGADRAIKFWSKVIKSYTNGNYREDIVQDPKWGKVTRQSFIAK